MTSAYNDLLSVYKGDELNESYSYGLDRLHVYLSDGTNETYSYDHLGSIVRITSYNVCYTKLLRDSKGRLTSNRYADGYSQTYTYDEEKRTVTLKEGTGLTTTYHYDDQLRLIKIADSKGSYNFV